MIQFDEHIFQMGWFNHQVAICVGKVVWKAVIFKFYLTWTMRFLHIDFSIDSIGVDAIC